jgi:twitching motility protein PilT
MEITELLNITQQQKASDLHLSTESPPVLRINGEMIPMQLPALSSEMIKYLLYSVMTEQQRSDYERELEIDFAISFSHDMRFRVNAFNTTRGPAAVLRSISTKILTLDQLGAPAVLKDLTALSKGLVLVTGPTGSGKSTTLAAMLNHINENYSKHILTVEDPVEYVHTSKRSLINHREIGSSVTSFARALKSALREDPDVILVGELRDLETIQLAMTAAETGHLVFGTLHTSTAPKTVDRIIDVFPANDKEMVRAMLSASLEAVITQGLLRRKDGMGRVAVHEIMLATPAVRNLIRENKIPQIVSIMQTNTKIGMRTMKDSITSLLLAGVIDEEEAKKLLLTGGETKMEVPASGSGNPQGNAQNNPQAASKPAPLPPSPQPLAPTPPPAPIVVAPAEAKPILKRTDSF